MNGVIDRIITNKRNQKIIVLSFLSIVLSIIAFLCISLVKYYNTNIVGMEKAKLFYTFDQNTIGYTASLDYLYEDISEQFLSYGVSYGVDVSEWQGTIDWEKVAHTGISFAMIRCGFRQTDGSEIKEDARFRENIEGAINAGLKVGVYFFGTAKNEEEALEEAEFTYNLIKDYNLTYPVAYDAETFNKGRLLGVSYSTITDNILSFTETLSSYGYETMVYSYKNAFKNMLDTGKLDGKLIWLAHYVDETDYTGNYNMWQYTNSGRVDGINTNVDLNISYFTYVDSEDEIVANPNYVKAPDVSFTSVNEEVKTIKNATMRSSATSTIPNKLGNLSYGTTLLRIGISDEFSKILYNGRVVYIKNDELRVV